MAAKRDAESDSLPEKKIKTENGAAAAVTSRQPTQMTDISLSEVTNETIAAEWEAPSAGHIFTAVLENNAFGNQSQDVAPDSQNKCSVKFSSLRPLTKYTLKFVSPGKGTNFSSIEILTHPSLEMPEIEEVQEGCAHLTIAPLPEDQAKNVEAYLLLVRPLEDARDYPPAEIKDSKLKLELESKVHPPFYLAYEFTHEKLSEEGGGQIQVGSGADKKSGTYGTLQDPKLRSGGNYRVVLVVIINLQDKRVIFAEESCQMLVK